MSEITLESDSKEDGVEIKERQELLDFLKIRKEALNEPVLKFILDFYPEEPSKLFEPFQYEYLNYDKLNGIVKDFESQWDKIKIQIQEYEREVEDFEKSQAEVIEDIDKCIAEENKEYEQAQVFIASKLLILGDIEDETIQEAVQNLNAVFTEYMGVLQSKRDAIADRPEELFVEVAMVEINQYMEWLVTQQQQADALLKKIIETHISTLVNDTAADMTNMCKKINEKIIELEERLRLKRLEMVEFKFRELKAKLSAEIETLRSRKSFLDLQLRTLLDLDQSLKELTEELRQEVESMDDTDEFFKNEIQRAMTDYTMNSEDQIKHIQKIKDAYEKAMLEHRQKVRKIEEEREVIKKALLDEFEQTMRKKKVYFVDEEGRYFLDEDGNKVYEEEDVWGYPEDSEFDFDEFGRYFIDHLGRRIYKEDEESGAYFRDEFGNFVEAYSPRMTGFKPQIKQKDCDYLKSVLGEALIKALGQVVLYQPSDPILYLAHWLLKYRKNIDARRRREEDRASLEAERDRIAFENRTHSSASQKRDTSPRLQDQLLWTGGESHLDFNLMSYNTPLNM